MKKKDTIHYTQEKILSRNKPINFILSKRGSGKSTTIILMVWKYIKRGYNAVFIRRRITDITDKYIDSIVTIHNMFNKDKIIVHYKNAKDGVVDIKDENNKVLFSVVALSASEERLKSIVLGRCKFVVFDEFIIRTKLGGRYLKNEYAKFQIVYTTLAREYDYRTRAIFIGNPYTLYNPYFHALGVNTRLVVEGAFIVKDNYALEYYKVLPTLQKIIDVNPFKDEEDDQDTQDDTHIKIFDKIPPTASLKFLIYFNKRHIGFWYVDGFWYIKDFKYNGKKKIYVLDLNDIENGSVLYTREDRFYLSLLNQSVKFGKFYVNSINTYYDFRYIYDIL